MRIWNPTDATWCFRESSMRSAIRTLQPWSLSGTNTSQAFNWTFSRLTAGTFRVVSPGSSVMSGSLEPSKWFSSFDQQPGSMNATRGRAVHTSSPSMISCTTPTRKVECDLDTAEKLSSRTEPNPERSSSTSTSTPLFTDHDTPFVQGDSHTVSISLPPNLANRGPPPYAKADIAQVLCFPDTTRGHRSRFIHSFSEKLRCRIFGMFKAVISMATET